MTHLLHAGPLRVAYENGDLRYVRLGQREILRRLYVAVRDHNWGTVTPVLTDEVIQDNGDHFRITYQAAHREREIDFTWQGEIVGTPQGELTFSMRGRANSAFLRNRIGFCILHPMDCAGAPARIEHVDGSVTKSHFPQTIAPQLIQDGIINPVHPFSNMRALAHEVQPNVWAQVICSGEVFEMEDQRNWTDASFKTYGTPLALPFPVTVTPGTEIVQSIHVQVTGAGAHEPAYTSGEGLILTPLPQQRVALPALGLGMASHGQDLSATEISRLRSLNLAHLRVDLHLAQPGWPAVLAQAIAQCGALACGLEVALFVSDQGETELAQLAQAIEMQPLPVARWLIFHQQEKCTRSRWVETARRLLPPSAALVGGGTNLYFTDLNRDRPTLSNLDCVSYSINPQVHAFDNASLVETLAAQAVTVQSARIFCRDLPIVVSPVTLRPRFNPNATGPEPEPETGQLPSQVDPRQLSLFGAGWTLGSLKYLALGGAHSITYYETTGWRGVMEQETGSPLPAKFPSLPGTVFPLYHVLADVGEFAGGEMMPIASSAPLTVDGILLQKAGRRAILLANFGSDGQTVILPIGAEQVIARILDESSVRAAMQRPAEFRTQLGQVMPVVEGQLRIEMSAFAYIRLTF